MKYIKKVVTKRFVPFCIAVFVALITTNCNGDIAQEDIQKTESKESFMLESESDQDDRTEVKEKPDDLGDESPESEPVADDSYNPDNSVRLYNDKTGISTDIQLSGRYTLVDNGIVYKEESITPDQTTVSMRYCFIDLNTFERKQLGVVDDWAYESSYDNIFVNGHLYTLIATGNLYQGTLKCYLYDFDVVDYSCIRYDLPGKVPYCTMAYLNNKLLIGNLGGDDYFILSFDIDKGILAELKKTHSPQGNGVNEVLRHITSDGTFFYVLRVRYTEGGSSIAYLDKYDYDFNLVDTTDITAYLYYYKTAEWMLDDEIRQLVSHFEIINDYVFYENFSMSRTLFHLGDEITDSLITFEPDSHKVLSADPNLKRYWYYTLPHNVLCSFDTGSAESDEYICTCQDEKKHIVGAKIDSLGNALVEFSDPNIRISSIDEIHYMSIISEG